MRGPCADDQGKPLLTHPPPASLPADEDGEEGDGWGEGGGGGGGEGGTGGWRGGGGLGDSRATEGGWWWLVVTKCCGDMHVPMGTCSIRASVGAVCGTEHILQNSLGHGGGASGARGGGGGREALEEGEVEGGGRGGGEREGGGEVMLLGGGMLAMPGFFNPSFSPGTMRCNGNGTVSFAWDQWDVSLDFEPFLAGDHEVVASPSLRCQPEIRLNDPQVLRQRFPSPPSTDLTRHLHRN